LHIADQERLAQIAGWEPQHDRERPYL